MALEESNPLEIDEYLHIRQVAMYGRKTKRKLIGSIELC